MVQLSFTAKIREALEQGRYAHPHPKVQRKLEALYRKSLALPHHLICRICQITKPPLLRYLRAVEAGEWRAANLFPTPSTNTVNWRMNLLPTPSGPPTSRPTAPTPSPSNSRPTRCQHKFRMETRFSRFGLDGHLEPQTQPPALAMPRSAYGAPGSVTGVG